MVSSSRDPIDRFFNGTLRLSHLRTLALLAELGQVRKVADAFHITQSAVSKQIAEIESGLEEAVVRREGNGLVLTPIGHRLATRAREILSQLDRIRQEVGLLRRGLGGRVVVGSVASCNVTLLPEAIRHLKERAPEMVIALEEDTADRLLPRLIDRSIDLAILRMWHPMVDARLSSELLVDEMIVMVVGVRHPLAGRSRVRWEDTMAYPWFVPKAGSPAHGALQALLARHGLQVPRGEVESISFGLNLSLLASNRFVGHLPSAFARRCAAEGRVAILPLDTDHLLSETRLFWRADDEDPAHRLVRDCVVEASREMQPPIG